METLIGMKSGMRIPLTMAVSILLLASGHAGAAGTAAGLSPMDESAPEIPDEMLLLDQVDIRGSLPQRVMAAFGPLHSMSAVVDLLEQNKVKFERHDGRLSLRFLVPAMARNLVDLPPGEPFVIPTPEGTMIAVIKGRVPAG